MTAKRISFPALIAILALVSLVAALIAARVGGVGGPWLWNFEMPGFDYPIASFYHEALRAGGLPLWNDRLSLGFPLYAEGQIGAFYPPNWLIFQLPAAGRARRREGGPSRHPRRRHGAAGAAPVGLTAGSRDGRRGDRAERRDRLQARVDEPRGVVRLRAVDPVPAGPPPVPDPRRTRRRRHPVGHPGASRCTRTSGCSPGSRRAWWS